MMTNNGFTPPDQQTHFLVSGGGKGITAENVVALAEAYQSTFTLVGRSELLPQEPDWSEGILEPSELKSAAVEKYRTAGKKPDPRKIGRDVERVLSSREIKNTLQRISRGGGSAEYIQADITQPDQLKEKLLDRLPDINALLHGAGALADKMIEDKTGSDFDLVYGVKIGGLANILQILPPQQLDIIVLFSSVAGFYGNAGQADYSLGNEILNKLAYHLKREHPSCQVLSINWGPWDGGMVSPQLKRILTRKNVDLITLDGGTRTLIELISSPQQVPQLVVGNPLPFPKQRVDPELKNYQISRELSLEKNPFLFDHVIGGRAVLPTVCAVAWFVNTCTSLYPGYQFHTLEDYRVFKGIVFDGETGPDYLLELAEIEKDSQEVTFTGKISSQDSTGKQRFHYQAGIKIKKIGEEQQPVFSEVDITPQNPISGQELYSSKTLFHGPSFQGVQQVLQITPEGLVTECRLPPVTSAHMGQFPMDSFNPLLADVHLQSLLIWAHHNLGSIGLPLQINGAVQHKMPPPGITTYASMQVQTTTAHKLVADVISYDRTGNIFTEVQGAEITLNDKLYELFQNNQLELEPV